MQSEKVLIMPERKSRLRREENPAYPEFAVEMLREFSKTISEEISPIREDIGIMKITMNNVEAQVKSHGEKLEALVSMNHRITTLETGSEKQNTRMGKIEDHVHTWKAILGVTSAIAIIIAGAAGILEVVKYFLK